MLRHAEFWIDGKMCFSADYADIRNSEGDTIFFIQNSAEIVNLKRLPPTGSFLKIIDVNTASSLEWKNDQRVFSTRMVRLQDDNKIIIIS